MTSNINKYHLSTAKELSSPKRTPTKSASASSSTVDDGDSLAWYERDLSDYDLSDVDEEKEEEKQDEATGKLAVKVSHRVLSEALGQESIKSEYWFHVYTW